MTTLFHVAWIVASLIPLVWVARLLSTLLVKPEEEYEQCNRVMGTRFTSNEQCRSYWKAIRDSVKESL